MKRKQFFLVGLVLIVLLLLTVPAPPSAAGADYLIAFTSAVNIDFLDIERGGIFVMRPDGSGVRQLTSFQTLNYDFAPHGLNLPDDHPAFSPDGTKIAFTSNREDPNNWDIYTMDVNGTNLTRLTATIGLDTEPVFSPDGTHIAFVSERSGNLDIWVMEVNGSNPVQITTNSLEDIEPAYSPDGSLIAFGRVQSEHEKDVFVMNSDGTNEQQLTFEPGEDHDATFGPTGGQLVITSEKDGTNPFGDVFKIRLSDGAYLSNLTSSLVTGGGDPAWSPDGSQVAFFKSSTPILASPQQLWVMSSNGTNHQRLDNVNDLGIINIHPNWGLMADTDQDGLPNYLENEHASYNQTDFATGEATGDLAGTAVALADYNHDGYLDWFVGIPGERVNNVADAGKIVMAFGSPAGPYFAGDNFVAFQTVFAANDLGSTLVANGRLGQTMISCDFNNDGFQDIAIGAPGQNRIFVSIGAAQGWQTINGVNNSSFGAALAGGDFNDDGRCDLAVGAPQENRTVLFQSITAAGAVRVYSGSSNGLSNNAQIFDQGNLPLISDVGREEANDQFGYSLAAGNLNGDFVADLAIGTIGEDIAGVSNAGLVQVVPGAAGQPLQTGQAVARDGRSLPPPHTGLQASAQLGEVLAIGNFNDDIFDLGDLVVGMPRQNVGAVSDTGLTAVYEGTFLNNNNIIATEAKAYTLASVGSLNAANARFGLTLATGDMSGDSVDDLAVAAPGQTVGAFSQAGRIYLIYGSRSSYTTCTLCVPINPVVSLGGGGLVVAAAQALTQPQVGRGLGANEHFGGSWLLPSANTMAIGDMDLDDQAELVIGSPEEDVLGLSNSGLVSIRYGIQVGESVLTPTVGVSQAQEATTFTLAWTHPEKWRDLTMMHLRWRSPEGVVLWIRYEEETNLFSLFDPLTETFAESGEPGSAMVLATAAASLDLANSSVVGSGPEGRDVTLTMNVVFKTAVAGQTYQIEQMVQDDFGNNQGFDLLGSWGVGPFQVMLPFITKQGN
jgi:Tol biopolymer transport system component